MTYVSSHLPHAAFLLHVFLDIVPNATLGKEAATCDLLKLLIAAISLQGEIHDVHCLQEMIHSGDCVCVRERDAFFCNNLV